MERHNRTYSVSDHSFAVCAYGESPYLRKCLNSLKRQTVKSTIYLCISTPNDYIDSIAKDLSVPVLVSGQKPGIGSDWNYALSKASTPLVTIAHQDDVYLPSYAEIIIEGASRAPNPIVLFTDYGELRNSKAADNNSLLAIKRLMLKPLVKDTNWSSIKLRRRILGFGSPICCPSVTYNLDAVKQPLFQKAINATWTGMPGRGCLN